MMNKDRVLITGIMNGDERILTSFYKDNILYVQKYILHNHGNMEDVEDIFQDALVILYQKLRSSVTEIRGSLKTYFYGICKNLWRNRLRRSQKFVSNEHNLHQITIETNDSLFIDIEKQEREQLYRKYFQKLSSNNKRLLGLFFDGKSIKEVSKITGYSEGYTRKKKTTVKQQLFRMIEKDPIYTELRAVS
ncbi:hypothetical protein GCM10022393_24190 [Aquimarina addita]|uniref:RNA polymerase sigma-70 region 2 domain-containing protein n=1 Tax=Aquimarina addita TaxID=870485 RepID=A0ABP6UN70_9FLAO